MALIQRPHIAQAPNPATVTSDHPAHPSNAPTAADLKASANRAWQQHLSDTAWSAPTHSIIDTRP